MRMHPLSFALGLCLCSQVSALAELPPVGSMAVQVASTFSNHWRDSQVLQKSAPYGLESDVATSLRNSAEISTHLAFGALVSCDMYQRIGNENRAAALEQLKKYLQTMTPYLDSQIEQCNLVISTSKRPSVVSEAEGLRKDVRTFKMYLAQIIALRLEEEIPRYNPNPRQRF